MSAAVHQSAIHFLAAHLPGNPTERQQVEALIRTHEAQCVAAEAIDTACAPCRYGHCCQRGSGCPIRTQEHRNG